MIDPVMHDVTVRLSENERNIAIVKAVTEERRKHIDDRFDKMEKSFAEKHDEMKTALTRMNSLFERLVLLVVASAIGYVMKWLLSGGLNVSPM